MHLFARMYPCGECAEHFQQLLLEMPPQVRKSIVTTIMYTDWLT